MIARTARELAAAARDARAAWRREHSAIAAALVLAALLPLFAPARVDVLAVARAVQLAAAATALLLSVRFAGVPSLGHGAFVGLGAFGAAVTVDRWGWPMPAAVAAGVAVAAVAGVALAPALVRLRPAAGAAATWVLAWLLTLALGAFPSVTGGAQGLAVPGPASASLHYELALAALALALAVTAALARSAPGAQLSALRQRPAAARALGASPVRLRVPPFVVSAALCGLAGALAVEAAGIADAADYSPFASFELFAAVFLGGAASVLGPAAGVAVLEAVDAGARAYGDLGPIPGERIQPFVAAALLLVVVALDVGGVVRRRTLRPPARPPAPAAPPRPVAVLAERLGKRYGGVVAADDAEFELRSGEIVALIGPNGSGKTTLLRLLAGAVAPDAGRVVVDGVDATGADERARVAAGIVRTLQATALFPEQTAFETALAGGAAAGTTGSARALAATPASRREREAAGDAAARALARVGLTPFGDSTSSSLAASAQRLLMIAAALATAPRALLLDEPAAGSAPDDLQRLADLLRSLRADGLAILLVEHNLSLVRAVADRVVVLESGRVIAAGAPDEVWSRRVVREAFLGRETDR